MAFDLYETKLKARQALHGLASTSASYAGPGDQAGDVTVRWHNKTAIAVGELEGAGYASLFAGIDKLIFQQSNLDEAEVTLATGGVVTITKYGVDYVFTLDSRLPNDGPENVYWTVTK
jgi:hypothetical protein